MQTLSNSNGQTFDVNLYFSHTFKGRGGWDINCEASYKGEKLKIHAYTTDSMFIDKVQGMKSSETDASWEEIQQTYSDAYLSDFEESLIAWCESVDESRLTDEE